MALWCISYPHYTSLLPVESVLADDNSCLMHVVSQPLHQNNSSAFIYQMFILTNIYIFNLPTITTPADAHLERFQSSKIELFANIVLVFATESDVISEVCFILSEMYSEWSSLQK